MGFQKKTSKITDIGFFTRRLMMARRLVAAYQREVSYHTISIYSLQATIESPSTGKSLIRYQLSYPFARFDTCT